MLSGFFCAIPPHGVSGKLTIKESQMRAKLTDLSVQKFPEGLYMDDRTLGFGIRVGKTRKTWLVVKGENRTKITLGHYPTMTLADARKRAQVTLGSPTQQKTHKSFEDAKEDFLALPRWRDGSKRVITSSLKHFTWKRSLDKITHEDVATALEAIKAPSARAHALKDIRTFFNWCVPRYIAHSPCAGLKMAPQPSRNRILSDAELKAVWNACEGTYGTIVKLLIITGQRKHEITTLKWDQITDTTITIPAHIAKNGREHTFPLGDLAKSLLPDKSNGWMFTQTDNDECYNGHNFHYHRLLEASGTKGWTLHDLRRTFATKLASLHTPIHVTEKLLNHVSGSHGGIVGVYQKFQYMDEQRLAITSLENNIKSICS
jgi:integrase